MGNKNPAQLTIGWAVLTILAITVTIWRIINHSPFQISLLISVLLCILWVYYLVLRKIDGPLFTDGLYDERLWQISAKAQRNAFWFLFISIWCLAASLEFFDPVFIKTNISLFLAAIGTIGLFIYMFCFVWQKYQVQD